MAAANSARHIYLVAENLYPTVIDSQVVDTLAALQRVGCVADLWVLPNPGDLVRSFDLYRSKWAEYSRRLEGRVRIVPVPGLTRPGWRDRVARRVAPLLGRWNREPVVVHARGHRAACIANEWARARPHFRTVYDVRGDAIAELEYMVEQGKLANRRPIDAAQSEVDRAARVSDAILAVSHRLVAQMVERHGADPSRCHVVPCLADAAKFHFDPELRSRWRREQGLEGRRVVVFPGSIGRWHHLEATLDFVARMHALDSQVYFVALTPMVDELRAQAAERLPDGAFRVLKAPHDQVGCWLNAADAGVLFRHRHPLNEVAAPTKFAEYALTGLPTLITEGIGDYSHWVAAHDAGQVIDLQAADQVAEARRANQVLSTGDAGRRHRIADSAKAVFTKTAYIDSLANLYRALQNDRPVSEVVFPSDRRDLPADLLADRVRVSR